MRVWGSPMVVGAVLLLALAAGCRSGDGGLQELTAESVRQTLNSWNPSYVKVMEVFGFYYREANPQGADCIAYVLLANPADKDQKLVVYEAHFKKLFQPDGTGQWYLTGLISHSAGLTRRQGWDTLLIPVKGGASR